MMTIIMIMMVVVVMMVVEVVVRIIMVMMMMVMILYFKVIHIYNRHADLVEQLRLPGMCSCFGWDKVRRVK